MNITSLIKITLTSGTIVASSVLTSCVQPLTDQQANAQGQQQAAPNPYAVPGLNGQTPPVAGYPQNGGPAPYQPLPGVPSDPPVVNVPDLTPNYGTNTQPAQPTASTTHDVIAGESLWRISRKYGVTVKAIQQANSLKNDTIWAGQKLNIPAGN